MCYFLPHFYPLVPYRMTAHCGCTVLLNSIAVMSSWVLYMRCLSIADPNYLNAALILRIRGIVKLNQGQPEVNNGQNYLGGSQHRLFKNLHLIQLLNDYSVQTQFFPLCACPVSFVFGSNFNLYYFEISVVYLGPLPNGSFILLFC